MTDDHLFLKKKKKTHDFHFSHFISEIDDLKLTEVFIFEACETQVCCSTDKSSRDVNNHDTIKFTSICFINLLRFVFAKSIIFPDPTLGR